MARSKNTGDRRVIEQHRQLLQQMLVTHLAKLTTLERQVPKLIAAGALLTCAVPQPHASRAAMTCAGFRSLLQVRCQGVNTPQRRHKGDWRR